MRGIMGFAQRHPLLAGLATFLPVMAVALTGKMFKGVGGLLGKVKSEWQLIPFA
jgi:hypothetical protein